MSFFSATYANASSRLAIGRWPSLFFAFFCLVGAGVGGTHVCAAATLNVPGAYSTIQVAVNAANPGDTIAIAAGTYAENVLINKRVLLIGAGSGNNPLVDTIIQSAAATTPVITMTAGGDNATDRFVIQNLRVTGASGSASHAGSGITLQPGVLGYLTFDNVSVVQNSGNGIDIDLVALLNDIVIRNSNVSQNGGTGLRAPASSAGLNGLEIADSHFDGNAAGGLTAYSFTLSNWNIHGSTFNDSNGPDFSYGMYIEGHLVQGLTIDCSEFSRNQDANINASSGLILSPAATGDLFSNITITHSKFDDNPNYGVLLQLEDGSLIQNMTMDCDEIDRDGYGLVTISYGTLGNGAVSGLQLHNNNFVGNTVAGIDNANAAIIDATSNSWGAANGPNVNGGGPGTGDAIINEGTGTVLFDPFRTTASSCPTACATTRTGPDINILKKTNGTNNDAAPGPYVEVGSTVNWTYEVTNTGNVTLTNVTVTDDQLVTVICPQTVLTAGESMTCTASGTATAGQYTNVGSVKGTPPVGPDVSASNPDHYFGQHQPTAADGAISGRILDVNSKPIDGVTVDISGPDFQETITDSNGEYSFAAAKTNGFYTVTPSRVNYAFSPTNRSFSLLGAHTEASFTGSANGQHLDPLATPSYFVRQQYLDFLNREPDADGLQFWIDHIAACGSDQNCAQAMRINVSAAFFLSIEFQQTGYFAYRVYKASYGNLSGTPVPVRLSDFLQDARRVGHDVVVTQGNWQQKLDDNKRAFTEEFVCRDRFTVSFPASMTPSEFVDTLNRNAGEPLSQPERNRLLDDLLSGAKTRAQVLQVIVEQPNFLRSEFNRAFVLMEYFSYLKRNPDDPPETTLDFQGYNFWLNKLDRFNGDFVGAEMVKAFLDSSEYRLRFRE